MSGKIARKGKRIRSIGRRRPARNRGHAAHTVPVQCPGGCPWLRLADKDVIVPCDAGIFKADPVTMGKRGPLTGLGVVSVVTGVGARPWPGGQILESTPALPTTSRPCRLCRVGHGGSLVRLRGAASGDAQDPMKTGGHIAAVTGHRADVG